MFDLSFLYEVQLGMQFVVNCLDYKMSENKEKKTITFSWSVKSDILKFCLSKWSKTSKVVYYDICIFCFKNKIKKIN